MRNEIVSEGNKAVVISIQENNVRASLYVNARGGIQGADITMLSWKGKTVNGARKWAQKQLAA